MARLVNDVGGGIGVGIELRGRGDGGRDEVGGAAAVLHDHSAGSEARRGVVPHEGIGDAAGDLNAHRGCEQTGEAASF